MPSAGRVDDLTVLLLLLALAVAATAVVRARPWLGLLGYVLALAFVPVWLGVSFGMYVSPTTAVSGVLVLALALTHGAPVRLRYPDIVLALLLGLVVVSYLADLVIFERTESAIVGWGIPYLVGRVLSEKLDRRSIDTCIALVFTLVAALALLEFVTGVNPFVRIGAPNQLYANWADIQFRAGIPRAEGAMGHSISLGGCLALAIPFVWASALRPWLKSTGLAMIIGASFVTFSRIGILSAGLALVLCFVFLRDEVSRGFRLASMTLTAVGIAVATPYVLSVFADAGDEAAGSAAYRGNLLSLLPSMSVLGQSPLAFRDASGERGFGAFRSIDSAFLLSGLAYGTLPLVLLALSAVVAVIALFRRGRTPALVGVVALLPALTSVAFITQFAVFFWFCVGLAASHAAQSLRTASRRTAADTGDAAAGAAGFHPVPPPSLVKADG